MGQEQDVNDLMKARDELSQKRDKLLNDITQLRRDLDESAFKQSDLERKIHDFNEQILSLQEKITQSKTENIKEAKRREQIELELKTSKQSLELKNAEFKVQTANFEAQQQELKKAQLHLRQLKEDNIRLTKENQILQVRLDNSRTQFTELVTTNEKLANDCARRVTELKEKEDDLVQLLDDQVGEMEQQRERLRSKISTLEQEIDRYKKAQEENRKQIDSLTRDREQLNKNCQKLIADNQKQTDQVKNFDQAKKTLEQDITNYKEEASKQRKIILKMEKERDRYITEAGQLTNQVLALMEEVKKKELELFDQKKKIAELETRLKQQQNLYEAVRSDRNLYSKNLIESQDEISEMKRKLKIMNHQIDQLKEEIQGKEQELVRAQSEHEKLKKEAIKKEEAYANQQSEFERLNKQLSEANDERKKQMKQLQQVIAERDVLGTQLVRRNDELALLYEKLKIQQSTLNKGELQYKARLEDLRILKLELKKIRHEKGTLQDKVSNTDDLKREVFHVQRELLRERTRCRALEEELENPMNVHRWRKLEGSDPSTFELIQKIQLLQKRLIQKTEEVVQKELLIQEKEKFYAELKRILGNFQMS
ncbi:unnamed protein product [Rotaria magnacalcarata]|uniref:Cilia- and flagella-associated protein 58 central coiled coil domain-containing protein n=2 Tax=Rotaria magnacalcarata TaxID=392030 RepID=A0A815SI04_9BILA|nr:unnamed protein product [Rotaria magnacalcarata]